MRIVRRLFSAQSFPVAFDSLFRAVLIAAVAAILPAFAVAGTAAPVVISSSSGPIRLEPVSVDRRMELQKAVDEFRQSAPAEKEDPVSLDAESDGVVNPLTHGCDRIERMTCGSSRNDDLTTSSCRLDNGNYVEFYDFVGTAGQTVTIDLMSSAFDTWVFLLNPTPTVVADNDDVGSCSSGQVGGGCNSRIASYTLNVSGVWSIAVSSFPPNVFGPYSLSLVCGAPPSGACTPNSTTLCLNNGRFRVQVSWTSPTASGAGMAVPETSDTGLFWFFSANNIEAIIKVVNGCAFNSRYWVFAGGLTNVQVTMTVTDTQTGTVRTYTNPQGTAFAPIQDTNAFATCP